MSEDYLEIEVDYSPSDRQNSFHGSDADELVYGGAKGGGKSCGLVMDCLAYALENPGALCYLFRENYDSLEANLIREWKEKTPKELYTYSETKHRAILDNGSEVYFRYIANLKDAEKYQGRSMDYVGVDELTKHLEKSIQILLSCLRSPKGFTPQFRGTCNPGGIGHSWVKEKYINGTNYGKNVIIDSITGLKLAFIPAKVYDNYVLMANDPNYIKRLENLPDAERKAFLHGDWDIFEGQYFGEYKREIHVIEPFVIPAHWNRYRVLDYGLDMLACYWVAIDTYYNAYFYKELYEKDLIISDAAKRILEVNGTDNIRCTWAPPDLWSRDKSTGKSIASTFAVNKVPFVKSDNSRVAGWYAVKEWLKHTKVKDIQTGKIKTVAALKIFDNCVNLTRCIPLAQRDESNPNDVANEPHEITHSLDAMRGFCIMRQSPTIEPLKDIDHMRTRTGKPKVNPYTGGNIDNSYVNY